LPEFVECLMKPLVLLITKNFVLPEEVSVWFQEATLVIDEFGCQRYNRPNIILGETMMSTIIALCIIYKKTAHGSGESLTLEIGAAAVTLCRLHRHVKRTYHQYIRNLPCNTTSADQTIKKCAMEQLQMGERVLIDNSLLLALDAQIWYTDMLRLGTPKCIDFLNEVLRNALTGDLEDTAKKGIPLYHQWQDLERIQKAVEVVLELKEERNTAEPEAHKQYMVKGAQRGLMTRQLKQLKARKDSFKALAGRVLAADQEQFSSMVSALAEVDRRLIRCQTTRSESLFRAATTAATPALESHVPKASSNVESPAELQVEQVDIGEQSRKATPDSGPKEKQYDAECIICFDNMACIVFTACGHLAYCKSCRTKALKKALGKSWADIRNYSKILRRRMVCPLCRQESSTAELAKFEGTVYQ